MTPSSLFFFFVIILSVAGLATLFFRYRKQIEHDVTKLEIGERIVYFGVVVAGVSALAFAAGFYVSAFVTLAAGFVITVFGLLSRRRGK